MEKNKTCKGCKKKTDYLFNVVLILDWEKEDKRETKLCHPCVKKILKVMKKV